ncbi:MAG: tRNA pseudouridine(54/55) synthase Pus10 [Candidatus Aenigmarchaeota archaeon]|nr:tRNA pseudouridine(54/55) synthase Pus10 [Candidatus Aenigmarchaeota archaeon]
MKFPVEVLEQAKNREKLLEILINGLCLNCLGRQFGMLGHGLTNAERGKILREFANKLNKSEFKEPDVCNMCNNFFKNRIGKIANSIAKKLGDIEFNTFLIGSIISREVARRQEELWERIGIEDVEPIKSEINRELGKILEKLTGKKFDLKNPDITIVVDLDTDNIRLQIRNLFVYGKYQKLVRGIPQTKWICSRCSGKGCTFCKGEGKLYPTSVQEIVEKPLIKATNSKSSAFHGAGRADIDARELDYRPFVLELIRPTIRKLDLKKMEKQINKSKKAKVTSLKLIKEGKYIIRKLKTDRIDKTYLAEVEFKQDIDKKKLKLVKGIIKEPIIQKTPLRVVHRRADKFRKRLVKAISYKQLANRRLQLKIRAEAGLYIKELISGDDGRTKPNISEILGNNVKKIKLDVIKIG